MRVLAVDRDAIVFVSAVWQTTCTALRAGEEGFLIDSPVLPGELEALPGVLQQSGFPLSGLLATHGDWDHLLGRLAFPEASLGVAESTQQRLSGEPGAAQRALRDFDEEHYISRDAPLRLGELQTLPVPGRLELGQQELELHPTGGHTPDGMALWAPWIGLLVCGDHLSPVEIPMLSPGGSLEAYRQTLERLVPLVDAARTVVPGHGGALERDRARQLLSEDLAYLEALAKVGEGAALPGGRAGTAQRAIHAENLRRLP